MKPSSLAFLVLSLIYGTQASAEWKDYQTPNYGEKISIDAKTQSLLDLKSKTIILRVKATHKGFPFDRNRSDYTTKSSLYGFSSDGLDYVPLTGSFSKISNSKYSDYVWKRWDIDEAITNAVETDPLMTVSDLTIGGCIYYGWTILAPEVACYHFPAKDFSQMIYGKTKRIKTSFLVDSGESFEVSATAVDKIYSGYDDRPDCDIFDYDKQILAYIAHDRQFQVCDKNGWIEFKN